VLLMATGVVQAVMFYGRQVGHTPTDGGSTWLAWLGVWPLALCLSLATLSIICFPDGRPPSPRWHGVAWAVLALAVVCSMLSALWPVEYAAAGVSGDHPLHLGGFSVASAVWSHLAHPSYAAFQVLWVVVVVQRWRVAEGHVRQQLALVLVAATVSLVALLVGLAWWGSPSAGLLAVSLVPVAAGWAIVHGQHTTAYSALSWLSRAEPGSDDLPAGVTQAVSEALLGPAALWMGTAESLLAVGVWPETSEELVSISYAELEASSRLQVQPVRRDGRLLGALSVERPDPLSLAEQQLLLDLAAQATLVIEHLTLADVAARQSLSGHLDTLSPREQDVLQLMSQGLSNAAICTELHLSIKTIEPVVSTIFTKLGLHADSASNRRVLAVLAYLRS
jgi:DNA-binding CsgD family transcriptional regulator